ncbi:hypothetical protein L2E82_29975 [Cichorium intybus]|uniref:Uncharacterized protein n=1 Tax=Cichorium intybus TaxID=13427 RepID=A0ACB9CZC3_CICIN|nr:hypothetical protein L2E82_29975 [Cichorium intybus]
MVFTVEGVSLVGRRWWPEKKADRRRSIAGRCIAGASGHVSGIGFGSHEPMMEILSKGKVESWNLTIPNTSIL